MKKISLTINDIPVTVPAGSTVLEAARQAGVDVPTLCHHRELTADGSCRMCIVEVEGNQNLPASCVLPAADGMKVKTESEAVVAARKNILRLMLSNHPLDCLTCETAGGCRLQDYCYRYDVAETTFLGEVADRPKVQCNPFILRDYSKCILCGLCVRACREVQCNDAIDFINRGFESQVAAPFGEGLEEGGCTFCGLCLDLCPSGALQSLVGHGEGRVWERQTVTTTCTYCGVGCRLKLQVNDGQVVGVSPDFDGPVNRGHMCVKGRFGWDFIHSPNRLRTPLVRKDGRLQEATWDEALEAVARGLEKAREKHGANALGVLSSARCTNEENYLLQKLTRAVLGTNNIDHCARL